MPCLCINFDSRSESRLCFGRQMEPLESEVFVDGVGSDVDGEEFNSEGCQWEAEAEEEVDEEEEEKQVTATEPPSAAATVIPEKVFYFPTVIVSD